VVLHPARAADGYRSLSRLWACQLSHHKVFDTIGWGEPANPN